MHRSFYLGLSGRRLPVATHLVLHENPEPEAILLDGRRLAEVLVETARRFDSPLALPVMDLTLEKDVALRALGVPAQEIPTYHFEDLPTAEALTAVAEMDVLGSPRIAATCDALTRIATAHSDGAAEVPVGMCIGPFSLLTKLIADPITPIYLAGSGLGPEDDDEVALLYGLLTLSELTVAAYCRAQIEAGATAIFVCEPAANTVYFSPKQIEADDTVFNDLVINPNLRLKALLDQGGVDLIFHDCGELTSQMISSFAVLDPVIASFGSPVKLWEAAAALPSDVVVFGNLPTKKFYSDADVPLGSIPGLVQEIDEHLSAMGHPYIVGSECDVLAMPGHERTIMEKVVALAGA
jgi:uroporphyrinogen-III decarboxylase